MADSIFFSFIFIFFGYGVESWAISAYLAQLIDIGYNLDEIVVCVDWAGHACGLFYLHC